ncbi:MAG TPA: hypothetical protein ENK02_06855 [Planctomycetes bacterium]|nr:hypothetical protein [Planctomycetota bacterium]
MTDLELPSLQIGRYIDLLKRRRWQLLPAALVGLLVGLLVAWLIPRYYQAKTLIRLQPPLLAEANPGPREDPFVKEVSKARFTIRDFKLVDKAVLELGWEEYHAVREDNISSYRGMIWSLIDRIDVIDYDPGEKRGSAMIAIVYMDRDPIRAAEFANKIRDLYLKRETELVRDRAMGEFNRLKSVVARRYRLFQVALGDLRKVQAKNPNLFGVGQDGKPIAQQLKKDWSALGNQIADLEARKASLESQIKALEQALERIPPERNVVRDLSDPKIQALAAADLLKLQQIDTETKFWSPAHAGYKAKMQERKQILARIEKLLKGQKKGGKVETEPNPLWTQNNSLREKLLREREGLAKRLVVLKKRYEKLGRDLDQLPEARANAERLQAIVDQEKKAWNEANDELNNQRALTQRLDSTARIIDVISEAEPPPAPTYPNPYLIAFLGAGLGLAVSIGLIFLLDLLQATWKTYEDVERGLPVPALGGVAHLDLAEDLARAKRLRVRVALISLTFLLLVIGIFVIWILDPVRLPSWLRDFMSSVFQQGG